MLKKIISTIIIIFLFSILLNANEYEASIEGYIVKVKTNQRALNFSLPENVEEIGQNKGVFFAETQKDIENIRLLGEIEYIEPNYEVTLFDNPSDEYYEEQTNLQMINVKAAWDIGCYGNDVKVGVIDSGVYNHSDLIVNILEGYNYRDKNTNTIDTNGHGTSVSGLIAAQSNEIGIVGVAHKAKIVPLKCFGTGMTTSLHYIVNAIYGAVDDFDCLVINMSFGLVENPNSLSDAVEYAISKGAIIIAAVGNSGTDKIYYPAAYKNVIGVGSVNEDKSISSFSQYNKSVFITAPGNNVKSLSINDGYIISKGTSFSAPLVTGAIAIAKCIDGSIDVNRTMNLLMESSEDLSGVGYDVYYGYGLINISAFINKMLENKEWFVSPLDKTNNKYKVVIYNNSANDQAATSVFASYTENKLTKVHITNVELCAGERIDIDFEYDKGYIKHFLWNDTNSMIPLFNTRYIK